MTDAFKDRYHVECISGMHHNKAESNLHIHLIFAERRLLSEVEYTYAGKTKYYDENGKSCKAKKQILDENGQIRPGCKIIRKGDLLKRNLMSPKDTRFQAPHFPDELRHMYVNLINSYIEDPKKQLHIFNKKGPYLPTIKYGKRNPKENEIKKTNQLVQEWNHTVDMALDCNITYENLCKIKQTEITNKVAKSIKEHGEDPSKYVDIVSAAIDVLKDIIRKISHFFSLQRIMIEITKKRTEINTLKGTIIPDLQHKVHQLSGVFHVKKRKALEVQIAKATMEMKEKEDALYDILSENGYRNMHSFENAYDYMEDYYLFYTKNNSSDEHIYDQTYNNELQKSDNPRSIDFLINAAQSLQSQNKSISESLHKKKEFERC